MAFSGPITWGQPLFDTSTAAPLFIQSVELEAIYETYSSSIDDQSSFVPTLGGGAVHQATLVDAVAPRSLTPSEIEVEIQMVSEEQRGLLLLAPALAVSGILEIWVDRWISDLWVQTSGQTEFVLSRAFFYATGPSFSERPARVFVDSVEQTIVDGTPSAGQFGIDQSADGNVLTAGTAPAVGALVQLRYYPLLRGGAAFDEGISDFNDGSMTLTIQEIPTVRQY